MAASSIIGALTLLGTRFWYVWFGLSALSTCGFIYFYTFWINMKKYAPESTIEMECSKPLKKKVEAIIIDASLHQIAIPANQHKDNPGLIDNENALISPNLLSAATFGRKGNGTNTVYYLINSVLPVDFRSTAALQQLMTHIRDNHPALNWMTESFEVLACVFSPTNYTYEDCKQTIVDNIKYGNVEGNADIEYKTKKLYDEILEIREEMHITRVKSGMINLAKAIDTNNVGISNTSVQELLTQQRRVDALGVIDDFFAKNVKYLTLMAGFAAVVLIFMMVLNYLH